MAAARTIEVVVSGYHYLVHPFLVGVLSEPGAGAGTVPVLLANPNTTLPPLQSVLELVQALESTDDVFAPAFAETLVVPDASEADNFVNTLRKSNHFKSILKINLNGGVLELRSGPYFLDDVNLHQAWRLYPDDLETFIIPAIPENPFRPQAFLPLSSSGDGDVWKQIAVPSRAYHTVTQEQPLAGLRMGVKDIFDVKGLKTTMMSRHYVQMFGPKVESADFVTKLLSLGAVILGKTRMTAFASSDEPTDQYIDFHCPVNPRGDRYQSPSGSSCGAAASLAGYDWLDISVAGDSAGSIRAPATCNGLFSLRPSFNTTSMKGVTVNSPAFDVVGFLTRDLVTLHRIASSSLDLKNSTKYPSRILYPLEFFPHSNPKHQAMVEEFIQVLEKFLGVKRTPFSISERWSQCPPEQAGTKPLKEYLKQSAFWSMCHDYYHGFDEFRDRYHKAYGVPPYAGAVVEFRWGIGKSVLEDEYDQYLGEMKVFREWFYDNVMNSHDDLLSDAVMIMPYGSANPKYRDSPNEAPSTSHTIGEKFISPVLHAPQLVLPFAQMPYESRVTHRIEHRPIASTLVGAQGSDLMLINLVQAAFKASSWSTHLQTGRYMLPLGDNLRNVAEAESSLNGKM